MSTTNLVEHRLGPIDQIPVGEGREFTVAGRPVAVFRLRDGGLAATQGRCPHRGGPLCDGLVGMGAVVCPLHNRRFRLGDGAPESGEASIAVYPVRVEADGQLVVVAPG